MTIPSDPVEVMGSLGANASTSIGNGQSLSSPIDLQGKRLSHIMIPSAWTTGNITFQVSTDGKTYGDYYDASGTEYTATVGGASRTILLPFADFIGVQFVKLRSGTTGTPVNQAAERIIGLGLVQ